MHKNLKHYQVNVGWSLFWSVTIDSRHCMWDDDDRA